MALNRIYEKCWMTQTQNIPPEIFERNAVKAADKCLMMVVDGFKQGTVIILFPGFLVPSFHSFW